MAYIKKVLFVCVKNSARSQMAAAILNKLAGEKYFADSAGLEECLEINPYAIRVLGEEGIDISNNKPKKVIDLIKNEHEFSYLITVCDAASAERCPIFPNIIKSWHWSFEDPAGFSGTEEEILEKTRLVKNNIKEKLYNWMAEIENLSQTA